MQYGFKLGAVRRLVSETWSPLAWAARRFGQKACSEPEPLTRQVRSKELGILQGNISMVIFSFDNGHLDGSIGGNWAWIGRA